MSIDGDWVVLDAARLVAAARQRPGEDVVLVGRDHEAFDRQAHALGVISRQDIAEIAGRNGERHRPVGSAQSRGGDEVIDDLRQDAGPVDRVDAREAHLVAQRQIAEQLLHDALAVVERSFDRERMDVALADRRHLAALDVGHAAVRIENVDVGLRLAAEGLDGRRAGVAGGRPENGRPRFPTAERAIHRAPEPLHGEILERQRRPVEELQREEIGLDLHERRGRGVTKAAIGVLGHRPEFV